MEFVSSINKMLKTIKDYINIENKKNNFSFDLNDFTNKLKAFQLLLQVSIIKNIPIQIENIDFFNERNKAILDIAKKISNAKIMLSRNCLKFVPQDINFKTKDFFYQNSLISENVMFVIPFFLFSKSNLKLNFEGITEYVNSVDRILFGTLQKFNLFGQIIPKVQKRSFLLEEEGKVEITIRPNFRFNKSIYSEKLNQHFNNLYEFILHLKQKEKITLNNNFFKEKTLVKIFIHSDKNYFNEVVFLKRHIKLIFDEIKIPVIIRDSFFEHKTKGISVTAVGYYTKNGEIDFSLKNSSFDINYESISYSKFNSDVSQKIIKKMQEFLKKFKKNHKNLEIENDLALFNFLFDDVVKKEFKTIFNRLHSTR